MFDEVNKISAAALNILKRRYFHAEETKWDDVVTRVINYVLPEEEFDKGQRTDTYAMILNRYFIPNSPCLVNSGKIGGGLLACFVVDFKDSILDIYKTKLDFALVAKKGGGCGTTLSNLRPKGSLVSGSVHGYAGGPIDFYDTICHEMQVITQAGFRNMAQMGTMSVYHPDILEFIVVKELEGKMSTTNLSVVVDDAFMTKVENDETYWTEFNGVKYKELKARDVFNLIVDGAWRNGEPGILFHDTINDSPYKYSGQLIQATNPCAEQPLPPNGSCNLGSIDISKFLLNDLTLDLMKFEYCIRLGIRFLDSVITKNTFPTDDIKEWALNNRPVGIGLMGLADYYLRRGIAYGSEKALEEFGFIMEFMKNIAEDESINLGEELGVPEACKVLPVPRRNVTLISIAPTGTISLLSGCNSGIEPVFSEIIVRNDKTGSYQFENDLASKDYFRCAVSANGAQEVTWEEHIRTQAVAQKFTDSGVSKTINFSQYTHKDTIAKSFLLAWKLKCKGITVYRDQSRKVQVLTPKNIKKELCPACSSELVKENNTSKCLACGWSMSVTPQQDDKFLYTIIENTEKSPESVSVYNTAR